MDTFQQFFCGFVGGVLGDELAGEGAGEEGGRERVHLPARLGQPHLKLVGQRKQSLHSPHDFLLLGERWDWNDELRNRCRVHVRLRE